MLRTTIPLILLLTSAVFAQTWPSASETAGLLREAVAALPGASLTGEIANYNASTLHAYLGDEATRYFAYDYQWTVASQVHLVQPPVTVSADVYRFGSDLDAFGAFSCGRDPSPPPQTVPLPGLVTPLTAYWSRGQLHIWRGPLYIRLVPAAADPGLAPSITDLAKAILSRLPEPQKDPPIFKIPPTRDLILESVKFQRRNVLGNKALSNALLASYGRRQPGKLVVSMELVLFEGRDAAAAQGTCQTLQGMLAPDGGEQQIATLGESCFALRHPDYGQLYVMRQSRYVALLRQVKDPQAAETVLRDLAKSARLAK